MQANAQVVYANQDSCYLNTQSLPQPPSPGGHLGEIESRHLYPVERVMYLRDLSIDGKLLSLHQILKIEVDPGEDFTFIVFAPAIGVGGAGNTLRETISSLSENIMCMWEELRATPPEELHRTAKLRLARLRAFLSE